MKRKFQLIPKHVLYLYTICMQLLWMFIIIYWWSFKEMTYQTCWQCWWTLWWDSNSRCLPDWPVEKNMSIKKIIIRIYDFNLFHFNHWGVTDGSTKAYRSTYFKEHRQGGDPSSFPNGFIQTQGIIWIKTVDLHLKESKDGQLTSLTSIWMKKKALM